MKSYPAIFSLCGAAISLAFLACGDGNGPLFAYVAPVEGVEPGVTDPEGEVPLDDMSSATSPMPSDSEQPDGELPLTGGSPLPPPLLPPAVIDEPPPPPDEEDPNVPRIVAVSPEDGARAVVRDTPLVITFSTPMNQEATQAAYQSEGIPSSGVTFSWNEDGTELTVTPNQPLEYATGTDPNTVPARRYSFFISASAEDLAGNRLASPEEFSFSVLRQINGTFFAVRNRDLTGSWRSNDTYGAGDCARNEINMCVGDTRVGGTSEQYKGFITFDLSTLPSTMASVSEAQLNLQITGTSGNPFGGLGGLFLEHADFQVIGSQAFDAAPLSELGRIATNGNAGTMLSVNVLSAVEADVTNRVMTQYRLRFQAETDNDITSDAILSAWDTQSLNLSYLVP
jgi:hypothetical protein